MKANPKASPFVRSRGWALRGAIALLAAVAAAVLWSPLRRVLASEQAARLVPVSLQIGFTHEAFLAANQNDVEAAFKVLGVTIGEEYGFDLNVNVHFYGTSAELEKAIEAHEINFAIFDALSFAATPAASRRLKPIFVPSSNGTPGTRYLLLVRRDTLFRSIADLRSTRIVQLKGPNLVMGRIWVDSLLKAAHQPPSAAFFQQFELAERPTAAVLPVYFGSRDACVVDESSFALMKELNPQVGAKLATVAASPPIESFVICASQTDWSTPLFYPDLIKMLSNLDGNPRGKQILTLFKLDHLLPYREEYLDSARALFSGSAAPAARAP